MTYKQSLEFAMCLVTVYCWDHNNQFYRQISLHLKEQSPSSILYILLYFVFSFVQGFKSNSSMILIIVFFAVLTALEISSSKLMEVFSDFISKTSKINLLINEQQIAFYIQYYFPVILINPYNCIFFSLQFFLRQLIPKT